MTQSTIDRIEGITLAKAVAELELSFAIILSAMINDGFDEKDFAEYIKYKANDMVLARRLDLLIFD